jgi:hypothetical protein
VKKCERVTKRSAAVWRLPPSVRHQQYYCAMSTNSLRTANRWKCAPHHREMFWFQVVASSLSPPCVTRDNCSVWSSSHFHLQQPFLLHLVTMFADFNFSWSPILITFLRSILSVSDEWRPIVFPRFLLPHKSLSVKHCPVCCPRCSERHTASVVSLIWCFKKCLQFIKWLI